MRIGQRTAAVVAIAGLTVGWAWAAQGRSLEVVVTYQGGGVRSVRPTPSTCRSSIPRPLITSRSRSRLSRRTVSFSNLTASPVYVTALYDEQGGFDRVTVLSGTPAGTILDASYAPMAIELTEGETATAELTFDDTFRMP